LVREWRAFSWVQEDGRSDCAKPVAESEKNLHFSGKGGFSRQNAKTIAIFNIFLITF
jgi:hypothetical protein